MREPPHPLDEFPPDLTFPGGHAYAPGPPPRRSYKGMWLAIVLVVLVVLAAVGAVAYLTYRLIDQSRANDHVAAATRVVEPAKLGALPKAKDAKSVQLIEELRGSLPADVVQRFVEYRGQVEQRDVT